MQILKEIGIDRSHIGLTRKLCMDLSVKARLDQEEALEGFENLKI
jgi:hypothetical protein